MGLPEAQHAVGVRLLTGDGAALDKAAGVQWLERAASAGHGRSQARLGGCYANGEGVAADQAVATHLWGMAAAQVSAHPPLTTQKQQRKTPLDFPAAVSKPVSNAIRGRAWACRWRHTACPTPPHSR